MGKHTALDNQIVEMVLFMKKNGVQRLVMNDDSIEIVFQSRGTMAVYETGIQYESTGSDETSYYYVDKDKN